MNRKIGKALVVGGGISGMRAALDLAETGYGVTLIDRAPHLGGMLSRLDFQFPTDRCGMCRMLPLVRRNEAVQSCLRRGLHHENIDIMLSTELTGVEGDAGDFSVRLRQKSTWVDPKRCVACGACERVCPVEIPDSFNAGFSKHKAIYRPLPHAVSAPYVIDLAACSRCGACEAVCPTGAIQLSLAERKDFRILVVDDELIVRDSLQAWLEDAGFFVKTAASGSDALELLGQADFQLMLTDIKMPGMDGVELLEKARADHPDLTVLMMTAYATIETAVESMKIGAMDYLVKPFDPETLLPMVVNVYEIVEAARDRSLGVGAIILSGGTSFYRPSETNNAYGYGVSPNVVTGVEFERILSGCGPTGGRLVRPGDGKPLGRLAWLQCVGSRDLQANSDFCSSICCMYSLKEARLTRARIPENLETTIFYMDMRTPGKTWQRYLDDAVADGVRLVRCRIHSVTEAADGSGDLSVRYMGDDGQPREQTADLVILATGQRPAEGTAGLADMLGIAVNPWGFIEPLPGSATRTSRDGVFVAGGAAGLTDISESVLQASSAAAGASRVIHAAGGSLASTAAARVRDVSREIPRVFVGLCACNGRITRLFDTESVARDIAMEPGVVKAVVMEDLCGEAGLDLLVQQIERVQANRILLGACQSCVHSSTLAMLGERISLDPEFMDVVDILEPVRTHVDALIPVGNPPRSIQAGPETTAVLKSRVVGEMASALARLRLIDPTPIPEMPVTQRALVVGGGIAGMTAALMIADHGFPVDIVECEPRLGGNLNWLQRTLTGESPPELLDATRRRVEQHPGIEVHLASRVVKTSGITGRFTAHVRNPEDGTTALEYGSAVLATGAREAATTAYSHGSNSLVMTQQQLEAGLAEGTLNPGELTSVVMIQCVDSREEPRNYCSRVCCPSTLKNTDFLLDQNPDLAVYVFYRDMMTCGFAESHYTRARQAGVTFFPYTVDQKPRVRPSDPDAGASGKIYVDGFDPVLDRPLVIEADLVVLATGMVPRRTADLASIFGVALDADGFFAEGDGKWRPVDTSREGVFICGAGKAPGSIVESVASAEAAAQRALRIIGRKRLVSGRPVATVRHSLCSRCEVCIDACPYGARRLDDDLDEIQVDAAVCQGCGACAAVCPNGASQIIGYSGRQMFEVIDSVIEQAG